MWTCIGFLTAMALTSGNIGSIYDYKTFDIGEYNSEMPCMISGQQWVDKYSKSSIKADFTCEEQIVYSGVKI